MIKACFSHICIQDYTAMYSINATFSDRLMEISEATGHVSYLICL